MKVKADGLLSAVSEILSEYEGATIAKMERAVDKAAKQAVESLKTDSPKRTGAYARDWAAKKDKQMRKYAYGKVVYNKTHYRVTHLLEKGHRTVNGGFVAARPHIFKVEQEAIDTLVKELKE